MNSDFSLTLPNDSDRMVTLTVMKQPVKRVWWNVNLIESFQIIERKLRAIVGKCHQDYPQ